MLTRKLKSFLLGVFLTISFCSTANASFVEEVGDFYNKITNPISGFTEVSLLNNKVLLPIPVDSPTLKTHKDVKRYWTFHVSADLLTFANIFMESLDEVMMYGPNPDSLEYMSSHDNFLLSIFTLGNDESQRNLNIAHRMATYVNQYHFFVYDADGKFYYLPAHLDAASTFLYGASYVLNIPQRALNRLGVIWEDLSFLPREDRFFIRVLWMIEWIISTLAQFLEFWFAVFGTIIGCVIAFIMHPINSICSFLGLFYFAIPTAWNVVVGAVLAFFGIFF